MKSPSAESIGLNLGKISIMAFWLKNRFARSCFFDGI